jgi:hypothetical protein
VAYLQTILDCTSSKEAELAEAAAVDAINEKLKKVYWDAIKDLKISDRNQTCQKWRAKQRDAIWFFLPAPKAGYSANYCLLKRQCTTSSISTPQAALNIIIFGSYFNSNLL